MLQLEVLQALEEINRMKKYSKNLGEREQHILFLASLLEEENVE